MSAPPRCASPRLHRSLSSLAGCVQRVLVSWSSATISPTSSPWLTGSSCCVLGDTSSPFAKVRSIPARWWRPSPAATEAKRMVMMLWDKGKGIDHPLPFRAQLLRRQQYDDNDATHL